MQLKIPEFKLIDIENPNQKYIIQLIHSWVKSWFDYYKYDKSLDLFHQIKGGLIIDCDLYLNHRTLLIPIEFFPQDFREILNEPYIAIMLHPIGEDLDRLGVKVIPLDQNEAYFWAKFNIRSGRLNLEEIKQDTNTPLKDLIPLIEQSMLRLEQKMAGLGYNMTRMVDRRNENEICFKLPIPLKSRKRNILYKKNSLRLADLGNISTIEPIGTVSFIPPLNGKISQPSENGHKENPIETITFEPSEMEFEEPEPLLEFENYLTPEGYVVQILPKTIDGRSIEEHIYNTDDPSLLGTMIRVEESDDKIVVVRYKDPMETEMFNKNPDDQLKSLIDESRFVDNLFLEAFDGHKGVVTWYQFRKKILESGGFDSRSMHKVREHISYLRRKVKNYGYEIEAYERQGYILYKAGIQMNGNIDLWKLTQEQIMHDFDLSFSTQSGGTVENLEIIKYPQVKWEGNFENYRFIEININPDLMHYNGPELAYPVMIINSEVGTRNIIFLTLLEMRIFKILVENGYIDEKMWENLGIGGSQWDPHILFILKNTLEDKIRSELELDSRFIQTSRLGYSLAKNDTTRDNLIKHWILERNIESDLSCDFPEVGIRLGMIDLEKYSSGDNNPPFKLRMTSMGLTSDILVITSLETGQSLYIEVTGVLIKIMEKFISEKSLSFLPEDIGEGKDIKDYYRERLSEFYRKLYSQGSINSPDCPEDKSRFYFPTNINFPVATEA